MTNDVAIRNDYLRNFDQVGHKEATGNIIKFNKGEWTAKDRVMNGAVLTAQMFDLCHGWRKWVNLKIVDSDIGFIRTGFVPKQRNDLDALDESEWSIGPDGKPSDPWNWAYYLRLVDENGGAFVWTASSVGARGAIGDLAKQFARKNRNPIVRLDSGSYKHAQYGKVFVPVLAVVSWEDEEAGGAPALAAPIAPPTQFDGDDIPF
jgi:hypothetical protein